MFHLLPMFLLLVVSGCNSSPNSPAANVPPRTRKPVKPIGDSDQLMQKIGLQTPSTILYSSITDRYLVSNINGQPNEKDDNGFIAVVQPNGKIQEKRWIDGSSDKYQLHAPKGMAIRNAKLYVADIDTVRVFAIEDGKWLQDLEIKDAVSLQDITVANNILYLTDRGPIPAKKEHQGGIYQIDEQDKASPLQVKTPPFPSGITSHEGTLMVLSSSTPKLYTLAEKSTTFQEQQLPKGQLYGLVTTNTGDILITSWQGKAIYRRAKNGQITIVLNNLTTPSGLGWDSKRKRVLVPLQQSNSIWTHPL